MPLLLRHALIRLLLLAVFFNTAIGMPAHQTVHLQDATAAGVLPSLMPPTTLGMFLV